MKENGFDYIDLGLPSGTMWATCNVGATEPEDYGLLFQFGRVDGYRYNDSNNQFRTNAQNKQDTGNDFIPKTASGNTYDKGETLDLEDDAAYVNMGGKWRMPTKGELKEFVDNTTHNVIVVNGVQGMMFTSKINDKRLFIPFAGYWYNGSFYAIRSDAYMWSSRVHSSIVYRVTRLSLDFNGDVDVIYADRTCAFSVRGVFKK